MENAVTVPMPAPSTPSRGAPARPRTSVGVSTSWMTPEISMTIAGTAMLPVPRTTLPRVL